MKRFFFLIAASLLALGASAQSAADSIPARKHPAMPAVIVTLPDGTSRANTFDLPEGAPTLFFFFSPDCDHCGMDADTLVGLMNANPKLQVVALSIAPVDKIGEFLTAHKLSGRKNLTAGQDAYGVMPGFFKVKYFPYFALYDGKKQLVETWDGGVKWPELRSKL